MSRFCALVLVAVCGLALTAAPAFANEPKKPEAKKADPLEVLLEKLEQKFEVKEGVNVNDIPLWELLQDISKRYGINFVINEESFKQDGQPNIKQEKPKLAVNQLPKLTVREFLQLVLLTTNAEYLIKSNGIEIVSFSYAAEVTKAERDFDGGGNELVSIIIKDMPLHEAIAKIEKMFSCSVAICPEAGDAKNRRVSARLLNVPSQTAVELLALQCDLRVVHRDAVCLITSKAHAKELFKGKLDEERKKIE